MQLTKKQEIVIKSNARWKVLNFGRRSGKTTAMGWEAFVTAMNGDSKITYYAQTFDDARNIAWDIFLEIFGDAVISKNETRLEIRVKNLKKGTSIIYLKGWESVVTSEKGRGTENDLLLLDEVAFCRGFKHYWDTVLEPTLLTTKGRAVFSSTPNGFNDFYDLANKAQQDEDWLYVHATSYDNPYNPPEELDRLKREKTDDAFAQEYLADFRKQEGLVYKGFKRDFHLFDKETIDEEVYMGGVDFGFVNPAGVVSIKRDKRGVYWVTDEYYEKGKTDAQIAEVVSAKEFTKVYPDPENQGAIKELRERHVNCQEVLKEKGSVNTGIDKIRELLKQRRIRIHKDCTNLIWEFETYHYPQRREGKNQDEAPVKENDHLLDALRYVVTMTVPKTEIRQYNQWADRASKQKINIAL